MVWSDAARAAATETRRRNAKQSALAKKHAVREIGTSRQRRAASKKIVKRIWGSTKAMKVYFAKRRH